MGRSTVDVVNLLRSEGLSVSPGYVAWALRERHVPPPEIAADFTECMHRRRGDLYHNRDVWSDRRAALLRGAMQGGLEAVRARVTGAKRGLGPWLKELRAWAEESPVRLDWGRAKPPDPPDPDGPPLRRDGVPQRLRGEVFGLWAVMAAPNRPVGNIERAGVTRWKEDAGE
jgi:hypothetical protein